MTDTCFGGLRADIYGRVFGDEPFEKLIGGFYSTFDPLLLTRSRYVNDDYRTALTVPTFRGRLAEFVSTAVKVVVAEKAGTRKVTRRAPDPRG